MMANWDLAKLAGEMTGLQTPLTLVVGAGDRAVPPSQAEDIAARAPHASLIRLPKLGHLAHEEDPKALADLIVAMAKAHPVV